MKIELSKRMQAVADLVPNGKVVCDVGCDHGFVSIYLVENHICPRVIAMDIGEGPLSRAREHIHNAGLDAYIETRLSDGLTAIKEEEADGMIAAGMGGPLMIKILSDSIGKVKKMSFFILEPQSEVKMVREWIRKQEFSIVKEDMVLEEGKYYPIMLVATKKEEALDAQMEKIPEDIPLESSHTTLESLQDEFGPCLIKSKHPVLLAYLEFRQKHHQKILEQINGHADRRRELIEEIERIEATRRIIRGQL